jgi:hypothetical protein
MQLAFDAAGVEFTNGDEPIPIEKLTSENDE